jgi:hypothetical protein
MVCLGCRTTWSRLASLAARLSLAAATLALAAGALAAHRAGPGRALLRAA